MEGTSLGELWGDVVDTQPDPSQWLTAVAGLVALVAVVPWSSWRLVRNAVTIAHEGGHGLVAVLSGRRLQGIRLHSDTSGLTVSRGKPTGPGMILTAAAGYTAPPLLGLAGAWLLAAGHITAALWGAVVLLAAMLLMIRNAYGVLTVVLTGAAFFLISWFADPEVQAAFAYWAVWLLLLGGVRPVVELQRKRRHGQAPESDADQLGRLTRTPAGVWVLLFYVVSLSALAGGGRWLLGL